MAAGTPPSSPSDPHSSGSLPARVRAVPVARRLAWLRLIPALGTVALGVAVATLALVSDVPAVVRVLLVVLAVAVPVLAVAAAAVNARSIRIAVAHLRDGARTTVQDALPASMNRLRREGPGSARSIPDAIAPVTDDDLGEVARSFNELHGTAVRVAAEQAALRANLDSIVVNLSRRTQTLVDRQLGEITDLESGENDPDRLSQLFRIDHLATRVRRHAESLLVLAGVEERRTTTAAPALDVARTAVGEVEQYQRVRFGVVPGDLVTAGAVDDIAHVLAELIDNATEFSPPDALVQVSGTPLIGGGLRIEVADTGIGLKPEQVDQLNTRLREGGELDVASSRTLGLYVVARLAGRHGLGVRLSRRETGGTLAQVDLPGHLLVSALDSPEPNGAGAGAPGSSGSGGARGQAAASPDDEFRAFGGSAATPEGTPQRPAADPSRAPGRPAERRPGAAATPAGPPPGSRPRPAETPLFDSVQSAWFSTESTTDWSSPADQGWQRAADALRSAEQAAQSRHQGEALVPPRDTTGRRSPDATAPGANPDLRTPEAPDAATGRGSGTDQPAGQSPADEPILGAGALPRRRRGASLAPGAAGGAGGAGDRRSRPTETPRRDASAIAGSLSRLQSGVGRGRGAGWVPDSPEGEGPANQSGRHAGTEHPAADTAADTSADTTADPTGDPTTNPQGEDR